MNDAWLVLSGGAFYGSWQAGAIESVLEEYNIKGVVGISAGGMNGAAVAQNKFDIAQEFWQTVTNKQMKTFWLLEYPKLTVATALILRKEGLISRRPLDNLVKEHVKKEDFVMPFLAGSINLHSGVTEYWGHPGSTTRHLQEAVIASATMPVVWKPITINGKKYIDGGGIDNTPISVGRKEADKAGVDTIIIINCHKRHPEYQNKIKGLIPIAGRALTAILGDVLAMDMQTFLDFNDIAKQAEDRKIDPIIHPRANRPLKYYKTIIIEPEVDLGNNLDAEQYWRYNEGKHTAKRIIKFKNR